MIHMVVLEKNHVSFKTHRQTGRQKGVGGHTEDSQNPTPSTPYKIVWSCYLDINNRSNQEKYWDPGNIASLHKEFPSSDQDFQHGLSQHNVQDTSVHPSDAGILFFRVGHN